MSKNFINFMIVATSVFASNAQNFKKKNVRTEMLSLKEFYLRNIHTLSKNKDAFKSIKSLDLNHITCLSNKRNLVFYSNKTECVYKIYNKHLDPVKFQSIKEVSKRHENLWPLLDIVNFDGPVMIVNDKFTIIAMEHMSTMLDVDTLLPASKNYSRIEKFIKLKPIIVDVLNAFDYLRNTNLIYNGFSFKKLACVEMDGKNIYKLIGSENCRNVIEKDSESIQNENPIVKHNTCTNTLSQEIRSLGFCIFYILYPEYEFQIRTFLKFSSDLTMLEILKWDTTIRLDDDELKNFLSCCLSKNIDDASFKKLKEHELLSNDC